MPILSESRTMNRPERKVQWSGERNFERFDRCETILSAMGIFAGRTRMKRHDVTRQKVLWKIPS